MQSHLLFVRIFSARHACFILKDFTLLVRLR